ncbi:MAG: efflux RND transporter periplasmic adaptor subunit [Bacteriovorax sp.]
MSANLKKMGIVLIVAVITGFVGLKVLRTDSENAAIKYSEYIVKKGNLKIQILSTGVVQPENKVEIKPPIAGRLEKVLVNEGDKVKKGQILAWMSSTERAAMLDAASAQGPKELKDWEEMYRATPILAAINGMIIQKNVESGQTFTTSDAILVMSDRLTVKAQVDETDIAKIKLKQKARITLDAYPEENIDAVVDQIAYDAKTVNNVTTYIVDVLPKVAPNYMRSGMTANVTFDVDSRDDVLLVPTEAIKNLDVSSVVLLPNPKEKDKPIESEVEIGLSDGKKTEIISGINEGDKILVQEFKMKAKKAGGANPFSPMGGPRGARGGR